MSSSVRVTDYNDTLQVPRHRLQVRPVVAAAAGIAAYVVFAATVAMPLYFGRWQADLASGKDYLGVFAGLHDLATQISKDGDNVGIEDPKCANHFMSTVRYSLSMFSGPGSMYDLELQQGSDRQVVETRQRLTANQARQGLFPWPFKMDFTHQPCGRIASFSRKY